MEIPSLSVRAASRNDIPGIVQVSNSSISPGEDFGFGGRMGSPFEDKSKLESAWIEPNIVRGSEVWVAELDGRIVGVVTLEDRGEMLELVNIDVPIELQGRGIGSRIVRTVEERARRNRKRAVTCGTSRDVHGVPWKSLAWWQHQGYRITHEEENDWTRKIGPGTREIRMRKDLE